MTFSGRNMNKMVFFFFFLNNKNLISIKAQHTEGTMVKVIWVSQQNSLELEGMALSSGLLSAVRLGISNSPQKFRHKLRSSSRQEESSGRIFLQVRRLSSWFQDWGFFDFEWTQTAAAGDETAPFQLLPSKFQVRSGVFRRAAGSLVLSTPALLLRWRPPAPLFEAGACRLAQVSCGRWRFLGATW